MFGGLNLLLRTVSIFTFYYLACQIVMIFGILAYTGWLGLTRARVDTVNSENGEN